MSTPFREMMCESLYKGHVLYKEGIVQIGYSASEKVWLYLIECNRCGRLAIIDRQYLDKILAQDYGKSDKQSDEPT